MDGILQFSKISEALNKKVIGKSSMLSRQAWEHCDDRSLDPPEGGLGSEESCSKSLSTNEGEETSFGNENAWSLA